MLRVVGLPSFFVLVVVPGIFVFLDLVPVFIEYVAIDPLKYARVSGPFGDRQTNAPHGADGGVCRLLYAVHQAFTLGLCAATVK